jgi:hypothetical protein
VGRRDRRDLRILVERDASDEVGRPGQPDAVRHRPRSLLLPNHPPAPDGCLIAGLPGRDVENTRHPIDVDEQRDLAVEQNFHAAPAARPDRARPSGCRQRGLRGGADDAVTREPRRLLERDNRRGRLRTGPAVHAVRGEVAHVRQPLLQRPRRLGGRAGRRRRRRSGRRHVGSQHVLRRERVRRDNPGEEAQRGSALDTEPNGPDSRHSRCRQHHLRGSRAQALGVPASSEALPEVDGCDAPREGDAPERRPRRHLRRDLTGFLRPRRARKQRRDGGSNRGARPVDIDDLLALQQRDLHRRRRSGCLGQCRGDHAGSEQ